MNEYNCIADPKGTYKDAFIGVFDAFNIAVDHDVINLLVLHATYRPEKAGYIMIDDSLDMLRWIWPVLKELTQYELSRWLYWALTYGNTEAADWLLAKGADVHSSFDWIVYELAQSDNLEALMWLHENGFDMTSPADEIAHRANEGIPAEFNGYTDDTYKYDRDYIDGHCYDPEYEWNDAVEWLAEVILEW